MYILDLRNIQAKPVVNVDVEKLKKTLVEEKMKKEQAVNKLAEIMNRKEFRNQGNKKNTASAQELKKKEKEHRKLQQELGMVCLYMCFVLIKIMMLLIFKSERMVFTL